MLFVILPHVWGDDPPSVDEFKKLGPMERERAIQEAPLGQRDELKKIDLHITLLAHWRGEEGLRIAKETQVAELRGMRDLVILFVVQSQVWDGYVSAVLDANEKAGMTRSEQIAAEEKLFNERDVIRKRLPFIHSLIFNMAASPEALYLDKRAAELAEKLSLRMLTNSTTPYRPITKEERMEVDKEMDQIVEEMRKLPKLTPEQAQKEYDALTDDKVRGQGYIQPLYVPSGQFSNPSVER